MSTEAGPMRKYILGLCFGGVAGYCVGTLLASLYLYASAQHTNEPYDLWKMLVAGARAAPIWVSIGAICGLLYAWSSEVKAEKKRYANSLKKPPEPPRPAS
jgi:hypothetical protein